jgi:Ferritin-like domain
VGEASLETQHVDTLTSAVKAKGGTPVATPKFKFPVYSQSSFLALAHVLEETGVGAYNGAGPSLSDRSLLAAAGSIVHVEARHAAAIALLIGRSPAPLALNKPLTKPQVLAAAGPLIAK